jgi:flagellar hook-associated protein 2
MAISSTGIISGLDVGSLIKASMAYERLPLERLQRKLSNTESQISAMGKVKSAISTLQEAAKALSKSENLYAYKASLSNADLATVTTNGKATAGAYNIEVDQLASSHKLTSSGDPSGGGTLSIEIGSTASGSFVAKSGSSPVALTIRAGSSMSDVARVINDSDAGVSATVINGAGGPQLVLTGKETGETNQIRITSSLTDAQGNAAPGFDFDPANPSATGGMTQMAAAQNAIVRIDGITLADTTSNTIDDAITGVSLTLKTTNTGNPAQLVLANDSTEFDTKLKAFVDAYNKARDTIKDLSKYDAEGKGANSGILNGDGTVSSALGELRGLLSRVPSGVSSAYGTLASLGIETSASGALSINSSKIKSAVDTDFGSVVRSITAYGSAFDELTTRMNGSEGLIGRRIDGLSSSTRSIKDGISAQEKRMEIVQKRYEKQFAGLETLLSSMTKDGNYLSQQLAALN